MVDAISTFPPATDARKYRTPMHAFAYAMGYGGRGLARAGALIGLSKQAVNNRCSELTPITRADRLAMTATLLNLPEFSERMVAIDDRCRLAFDLARAELERCMALSAPAHPSDEG